MLQMMALAPCVGAQNNAFFPLAKVVLTGSENGFDLIIQKADQFPLKDARDRRVARSIAEEYPVRLPRRKLRHRQRPT